MEPDQKGNRIYSLDVLRGATIAGMILVNNPGNWGAIYSPLEHAAWNGLTPTDLIFPFFLFIVGVSISVALGKRAESGDTRDLYFKIFKRAAIIFAFGLFLNAFPFFELGTLRIPGVLQRIAVCYLVASIIFLNTDWKRQAGISVVLLVLYWITLYAFRVPGCEVTSIGDKACNIAAYVDRSVLTVDHIWSLGKVYDPEGILSTIPAIVTTISGILTGTWLKTARDGYEKTNGMFFAGTVLLIIGWAWSFWFPFNKALWTSSYVVYTSGLALVGLAAVYFICDLKGYTKWAKPFKIFGSNAIVLYMGAELTARLIDVIPVGSGKAAVPLKTFIYGSLYEPFFAPKIASLLFALTLVLIWLGILSILYRKRIFLKV